MKSTRFLSCFDDKMYIQNNEYDGLALGYLIIIMLTWLIIKKKHL